MIRRWLAPFIGGLCVAASMPPWGWWPLAFLGIALYGSVAYQQKDISPIRTGMVFVVGWMAPAMAWMWFLTAPGFVIAIGIFAVAHGLAAYVAGKISTDKSSHATALIVCHSLAEVLRLSFPFGGVPLATLGISQVAGPLGPIASISGVIGVTAVVLWLSLTHHRVRAVLITILLVFVSSTWNGTRSLGRELQVAIVQGGGEQGTHAIDTNPRDVFDVHMKATRTLQPDSRRDVVIWPENVINITRTGLFVDSVEYREIAAEAKRLDVPFVVGITEDAGPTQFTNAQVVVEPNGIISGRYDKVRRVPFGEYMPMRSFLTAVGAPTNLVPRDARPGDARGWLDVADTRVAVAISWEVFFGGRVNEGVTDGATFILNPTNGSSYTWTILQTQQIAASQLRAIEQGLWVVQVSPTGFSAFIDPSGTVHERTSITKSAVLEHTIELRTGQTTYSRMGNAVYIWMLLLALGYMVQRKSRAIPKGAS